MSASSLSAVDDTAPNSRARAAPLAVLCIGLLVYHLNFGKGLVTSPAELAPWHLAYALAAWAPFAGMFLRNTTVGAKAAAFVAIFAALFTGAFVGGVHRKGQTLAVYFSLQDSMAMICRGSAGPATSSDGTDGGAGYKTRTGGDVAEVERFILEASDQVAELGNAFKADLEAIGWNDFLAPERLAQDRTLAESRAMLRQAKAIVAKYEAQTAALVREAQSRVPTLSVSKASKSVLLNGLSRMAPKVKLQWALERKVVAEFEKIIDLLASRAWTVAEGEIRFASGEDAARFDAHRNEVRRLAQQQQQMAAERLAAVYRSIEEFRAAAGR